jgi:hypothetical protein
MIEVDGEEREFRTGDRVAIPPGMIHRDPWNTNSAELHARGTFEPINDFIEAYAEAYVHHLTETGRLDDQDEMPLLRHPHSPCRRSAVTWRQAIVAAVLSGRRGTRRIGSSSTGGSSRRP